LIVVSVIFFQPPHSSDLVAALGERTFRQHLCRRWTTPGPFEIQKIETIPRRHLDVVCVIFFGAYSALLAGTTG